MPQRRPSAKTGMNRCLQAPEILQLICSQLPNDRPSDRQRLLAVALSCRALLEPALDRLWLKIPSFRPIMATLPTELWKVDKKGTGTNPWTVLGVRRAIVPTDLDRYMAYYAHRIREVDIGLLKATFSLEVWLGLQMATSWKHGALSPSAQKINWALSGSKQAVLSKEVLDQAFPFFSLFMGPNTSYLSFTFASDTTIHTASVRSAPGIPSRLKELQLIDVAPATLGLSFLTNYLRTTSWNNLEILRIANISADAISHLSALPNVTILEIWSLRDLPRLHVYSDTDWKTPPPHVEEMPNTAFPSLETLNLISGSSESIEAFIQHLPPDNYLHTLQCTVNRVEPSGDAMTSLLASIRLHCDPKSLRKLVLKTGPPLLAFTPIEDLEMQPNEGVNLTPLSVFEELEELSLNFPININLLPADIDFIVESFPLLVKLKVDTNVSDAVVARLDHNHVLRLLYDLPFLKKLGLRFDATQITGEEMIPASSIHTRPAPLEKIWVGDSPIYSPEAVIKFLERHCPNLNLNKLETVQLNEEYSHSVPVMVYKRRWMAVRDSTIVDRESP
ncbi:hypothetical protein D9611_008514 [Ephemerocybe angulata]|uniref:F-box domain-containing protein n=1 Tax=Ephemerocybe angulata TaxID=980116 RepID=A0A8H5AZC9_9AGAR|nr:hypothetical protein D9611_008514 [Tulosesus angulatus]